MFWYKKQVMGEEFSLSDTRPASQMNALPRLALGSACVQKAVAQQTSFVHTSFGR